MVAAPLIDGLTTHPVQLYLAAFVLVLLVDSFVAIVNLASGAE